MLKRLLCRELGLSPSSSTLFYVVSSEFIKFKVLSSNNTDNSEKCSLHPSLRGFAATRVCLSLGLHFPLSSPKLQLFDLLKLSLQFFPFQLPDLGRIWLCQHINRPVFPKLHENWAQTGKCASESATEMGASIQGGEFPYQKNKQTKLHYMEKQCHSRIQWSKGPAPLPQVLRP